MSSPVQPGDLVASKYRVDRVLGEGGMGIVLAATHQELGQRVALKFLLPEAAARPELAKRFLREARAIVRIHSEHVARVLDVGTLEAGQPYIVMEYLEGEDLSQLIATRELTVAECVGYVLEASEAIAEAHSLGIVHRDLKPANLFLAKKPGGKPTIKVLDFGISKLPATEKDVVLTHGQTLMGSPGYMAPEQITAASTIDARADLWSLGVLLYEMLARRLPFQAETVHELIGAIIQNEPIALSTVRPDLPAALVALVHRCLQKDRERRFPDIAELARALAPFGPPRSDVSVERIEHLLGLVSGPLPPMRVSFPSNPLAEQKTFAATSQAATEPSQQTKSRRGLVLPVALLGVVGGAALVFALARRGPSSASAGASPTTATPTVQVTATAPPSTDVAIPPAPAPPSVTDGPTPTAPSSAAAPASPASSATASPPRRHGAGSSVPAPASTPRAAASSAASSPSCHLVAFFDSDGNKHFKQVCP